MEEGFTEACESYLNERVGDGWQRYGLDVLRRDVIDVIGLEDSQIELTMLAERCVEIVKTERRKMKRIDEWNRRQKEKT
jgi:oligoribonuclease (3'-5' exoribonuclease)